MNNEQLAAAVAKVKELDAKRTQGETDVQHSGIGYRITFGSVDVALVDDRDCAVPQELWDAQFLAHSGDMAAIITQLWDERQAMLEVLTQVRDGLQHCRPDHVTQPLIKAIDAVLNQRSE